jgi:hypothetical protein
MENKGESKSKMSAFQELFKRASQPVPEVLSNWEDQVDDWCAEYCLEHERADISEITLGLAVFLFDHTAERVTLAYTLSVNQLMKRDTGRMRGFPDVNVSVHATMQENVFALDKGHFLGHAGGGILDINLFPHRRELNRGWSPEGRLFRKMERHVEQHPGTFFYHRPIYDDNTWTPRRLEYGVLVDGITWWVDTFRNK